MDKARIINRLLLLVTAFACIGALFILFNVAGERSYTIIITLSVVGLIGTLWKRRGKGATSK